MAAVKGQQDLVELINWSGVEVLNITADRSYENALKKGYRDDPGLFIESDCDEQILIRNRKSSSSWRSPNARACRSSLKATKPMRTSRGCLRSCSSACRNSRRTWAGGVRRARPESGKGGGCPARREVLLATASGAARTP